MRLIELRLKNLNSLKGEWHINFADSAFINEGIFAITGQTGAGKTTILDAVCLALYGETPRINSISKSSNEVMTRQTADCYAEVVIDLNGSHYRCRWGQRRAYGKSEGNLQDATHEIAQLDLEDSTKAADILESKLSRTKDKIVELTRMDFQQFTRSILLAQGSFSAFLKAKADERADILEKITGTDIYATISTHVFEKKRSEEESLSKLQFGLDGLTLLSAEEESALSESLATQQAQQHEYQLVLTQLSEQINWLDTVSELQQRLITHHSEFTTAEQAQQDFIPDARRLNAANKALELDSQYGQLTYSRDHLKILTDELNAVSDNTLTQQADFAQATVKLNSDNKFAEQSSATLHATLPILAQVRALDADIKQHTHSLADNTRRKDNLAVNIERLSQELGTHKLLQVDSAKQLEHVNQLLTTHSELSDLDTDIATFSTDCTRIKALLQHNISSANDRLTVQQQASELHVALAQLNEQQAADKLMMQDKRHQYTNLQSQQAQLIAGQSLHQMRVELEHVDLINHAIEQVVSKLQQVADFTQKSRKIMLALPIINEGLAANTLSITTDELAMDAAKAKRQDKQTHLDLLRQVARLEDYIVELKDNHPCPLCGATEHPYAGHHPILAHSKNGENELSVVLDTEQQIKALDVEIENLQQALSAQHIESATKQHSIDQQQQHLLSLTEQITTAAAAMQNIVASIANVIPSDDAPSAFTKTISAAITTINQPIQQIQTTVEDISLIDSAFIDTTQSLFDGTKAQLTEQKIQLKSVLAQYEDLTESISIIAKAIEDEEQQRLTQTSAINDTETNIKLNKQQLTALETAISNHFSDLQALDASVLALITKYPADNYDTFTHNALDVLDASDVIEQRYTLSHSIEEQRVLSEEEADQHMHYLRQQCAYLLRLKKVFIAKKDEQQSLITTLSTVQTQIETKQAQLDDEDSEFDTLNQIVDDSHLSLMQLQQQREDMLKNIEHKNPDIEEQHLRDVLEYAKNEQVAAQRLYDKIAQLLAQSQHHAQKLDIQVQSATTTLTVQQSSFGLALASSEFADEIAFIRARLPVDERNRLTGQQQKIEYTLKQTQAALQQTQQALMEKQANPLTLDDKQTLIEQQQQTQDDSKRLLEAIGAMSQQLKDNDAKKGNQQAQRQAIADKQDSIKVWQQLYKLIGSKDGKKYRTFAQGLTFDIMVKHANAKLHKMSDRYLLIRDDNNPLELNVIDNYQGGEIRSTKNLSGGEGFIISLALALGLSQMASQNIRVDSLFLDEGFGTLDDESLDIALDTLTSLQQEGKLIGVISHVHALKERILTQIQVKKLSGGYSQITGQGCYHLSS